MKLPKQVKVGGHILDIHVVPSGALQGSYGGYIRSKGEILLNEDQTDSQMAASLIHEILHAIFADSGLYKDNIDDTLEEKVVCVFETGLYQIMRDNPKVIQYIMGGGK